MIEDSLENISQTLVKLHAIETDPFRRFNIAKALDSAVAARAYINSLREDLKAKESQLATMKWQNTL